jgi:1,4-dihydroxy-2-naphthoate polyprenyltransferase
MLVYITLIKEQPLLGRMIRIWVVAARPKTLWASCAPVVIGTAMAYHYGAFHWPSALCALVGAMLIQIGTNYANDYFDFVKGADTAERLGPLRATQAGLVRPIVMLRATMIVFNLVAIPGAFIVWRGGWPFLLIGILSILFGILYTAGPHPLAYLGLGDVFVLIFFGPVAVCGTYYLQAQALSAEVVIASIAPGLLSVALLTVNNLRDVDEDRRAGKRTLAVRLGRNFARMEFLIAVLVACVVIPLYFYWTTQNRAFAATPLITLPFAILGARVVLRDATSQELNGVLGLTGKLLLIHSVVFSLGWLL